MKKNENNKFLFVGLQHTQPHSSAVPRKPEMKKSPSKDQASWMLFDIDS